MTGIQRNAPGDVHKADRTAEISLLPVPGGICFDGITG